MGVQIPFSFPKSLDFKAFQAKVQFLPWQTKRILTLFFINAYNLIFIILSDTFDYLSIFSYFWIDKKSANGNSFYHLHSFLIINPFETFTEWAGLDLNPIPQPWKGCVLTFRLRGRNTPHGAQDVRGTSALRRPKWNGDRTLISFPSIIFKTDASPTIEH